MKRILDNIDNLKHKCIISLAYSAGLRLNEVINMNPGDIDSSNNCINIRQGKGRKDRLERGTDLRYIQELLGHQSSRTTEIYTHITQKGLGKIKSPLDNLDN